LYLQQKEEAFRHNLLQRTTVAVRPPGSQPGEISPGTHNGSAGYSLTPPATLPLDLTLGFANLGSDVFDATRGDGTLRHAFLTSLPSSHSLPKLAASTPDDAAYVQHHLDDKVDSVMQTPGGALK